jgi:gliding motility-associated-like protein
MHFFLHTRLVLLPLLCLSAASLRSQSFSANLTTIDPECAPAEAFLTIAGRVPTETITIEWSNGLENAEHVYNLEEGNYSVKVSAIKKVDTVYLSRDTVIAFAVAKQECPVYLPEYFSPNSDGYNDFLTVGNVDNYPDFEFHVFNKWGQQVHMQKKHFIPWDGSWAGIALPDGTYYYIFVFDSSHKQRVFKGDVTILR